MLKFYSHLFYLFATIIFKGLWKHTKIKRMLKKLIFKTLNTKKQICTFSVAIIYKHKYYLSFQTTGHC